MQNSPPAEKNLTTTDTSHAPRSVPRQARQGALFGGFVFQLPGLLERDLCRFRFRPRMDMLTFAFVGRLRFVLKHLTFSSIWFR